LFDTFIIHDGAEGVTLSRCIARFFKSEIDKKAIPLIIIVSPVFVGMAAVTGPPLLLIEGIRRLKPAKVLYKVVP
jgi:hypothetical protein